MKRRAALTFVLLLVLLAWTLPFCASSKSSTQSSEASPKIDSPAKVDAPPAAAVPFTDAYRRRRYPWLPPTNVMPSAVDAGTTTLGGRRLLTLGSPTPFPTPPGIAGRSLVSNDGGLPPTWQVPPRNIYSATDVYINGLVGHDTPTCGGLMNPCLSDGGWTVQVGVWGLLTVPVSGGGGMTVHYEGALPADTLNLQAVLDHDVVLVFDCSAILQTIRTGTLTGFVPTGNANNPPAPELVDTAASSLWDADVLHMHRIRMTSGAATGSIFWAAKDLGSGVLRTGLSANASSLPSAGDAYIVESLPPLYVGLLDLDVVGTGVNNGAAVGFENTWVATTSQDFTSAFCPQGPNVFYEFIDSIVQIAAFTSSTSFMLNCLTPIETSVFIGATAEWSGGVSGEIVAVNGGTVDIDGGTTIERMTNDIGTADSGIGALSYAQVQLGNVSICDAINSGGDYNTQGDGVFTGDLPIAYEDSCGKIVLSSKSGNTALSGNGNAGYGWRVGRGCSDSSRVIPTITGTQGDLILDQNHTTVVKFDPGTSTWLPTGGGAVTWANIAANFNGKPHDPATNTAWIGPP